MNFKPCGDKMIIKPDPVQEKTKSGLYKPQTALGDSIDLVSGVVVEISDGFYGQGVGFVKSQFKVGDRVYYQQLQGKEIEQIPDHVLVMEAAIVMREKREPEDYTDRD